MTEMDELVEGLSLDPAPTPEACLHAGGSTSLVLDAELVAIDRADGNRLKAFQELSTRARGEVAAHQVSQHTHIMTAVMWHC